MLDLIQVGLLGYIALLMTMEIGGFTPKRTLKILRKGFVFWRRWN